MDAIVWLIIFAVLVVVEIMTLGLTTIWFAIGALVAFISAMFGAPAIAQIVLFLIFSTVSLGISRPILMKSMNRNKVKTNVEGLLGQTAIVKQDISNLKGTGQVIINGVEWTARSIASQVVIEKNSVVRILAIDGVKLIVEFVKSSQEETEQETFEEAESRQENHDK